MSLLPTHFGISLTVFKQLRPGVQLRFLSISVLLSTCISKCIMFLVFIAIYHERTPPYGQSVPLCCIFPRKQATCRADVTAVQSQPIATSILLLPLLLLPMQLLFLAPKQLLLQGLCPMGHLPLSPGLGTPCALTILVATLMQE
jgi:hypothetical protein